MERYGAYFPVLTSSQLNEQEENSGNISSLIWVMRPLKNQSLQLECWHNMTCSAWSWPHLCGQGGNLCSQRKRHWEDWGDTTGGAFNKEKPSLATEMLSYPIFLLMGQWLKFLNRVLDFPWMTSSSLHLVHPSIQLDPHWFLILSVA